MGGTNSNVSSNDKIASSNLGDGGWVSREEFESSLTKCLGTSGVLSELLYDDEESILVVPVVVVLMLACYYC